MTATTVKGAMMDLFDLIGPPPEPEASRYRRTAETTWSAWRNGRVRHHYSQSPDAVLDAIERRRGDPLSALRDVLDPFGILGL